MKNILFLISIVALLLTSCDGDAIDGVNGTVSLNFNTEYNESPLALNQEYTVNGDTISFITFKYYLSDIQLGENYLEDVALIDLGTSSSSLTLESPVGTYDQLSMGIGVHPSANDSDPASYASDHPLSYVQSNYWAMLNSYVFIKIEGFYTQNGVSTPFAYHVGANPYYRQFSSAANVLVTEGDNTTIDITLNVNDVLQNINLPIDNDTHTSNNPALAALIADNFLQAIEIE